MEGKEDDTRVSAQASMVAPARVAASASRRVFLNGDAFVRTQACGWRCWWGACACAVVLAKAGSLTRLQRPKSILRQRQVHREDADAAEDAAQEVGATRPHRRALRLAVGEEVVAGASSRTPGADVGGDGYEGCAQRGPVGEGGVTGEGSEVEGDTAARARDAEEEAEAASAAWVVGAAVLAVYTCTMYRTVPGGDSGELIVAGCTAGIAHPPGYPTYTMLAILFHMVLAPLGSPAWRINMLSVVLSTACAVQHFRAIFLWDRTLTRRRGGGGSGGGGGGAGKACRHQQWNPLLWSGSAWGAAVGALSMSWCPLMWQYAIQAEVLVLNCLLTARVCVYMYVYYIILYYIIL